MGRRFEILKNAPADILWVDDYAHHPSEVQATLKASKEALAGTEGRLIAIFQPHRYTRLKALWDEFVQCFGNADHLIIADVYAAHEAPISGINSESLAKAIQAISTASAQTVTYIPNATQCENPFAAIRAQVDTFMKPGDLVISMGAGSITSLLRQ
jgi:UDP-N-acetylmuramate--alanine ligase